MKSLQEKKLLEENCRFNLLLIYLHLHFHFYFYPLAIHRKSDMKMFSEPKSYLRGDIERNVGMSVLRGDKQ